MMVISGYKSSQLYAGVIRNGSCDSGKCFANYMISYIGYFFLQKTPDK